MSAGGRMSLGAAGAGGVKAGRGRWLVDTRLMGLAIVAEVAVVCLAYMAVYVPVLGPKLTREEAGRHWLAATIASLVVVVVAATVVRNALRARRASVAQETLPRDDPQAPARLPRVPQSLRFARVDRRWTRLAAGSSLVALSVSAVAGAPLWLAWLTMLAPWAPIVAVEARHRFALAPVFACFGLLVILQLLHMVEHSTQVGQLLATGGAFARSHGVIGQLDFELVHFVFDTTLWASLGLLAIIYKARNAWLWVAFAAACLHQIEHFYLLWLYIAQHTVYLSGGAAGIMGHYGLIGSPLDRPYLHYTYNLIVIVPMLVAFWDEARYTDRVDRAGRPPANV